MTNSNYLPTLGQSNTFTQEDLLVKPAIRSTAATNLYEKCMAYRNGLSTAYSMKNDFARKRGLGEKN